MQIETIFHPNVLRLITPYNNFDIFSALIDTLKTTLKSSPHCIDIEAFFYSTNFFYKENKFETLKNCEYLISH